ncbi:hypothetical protein ACFO5X_08275 [Seohaeicola nanhaiensis]|uniref:DUF1353 domain-containing protein n=1 Tax=Seohaeicola nanhaiensis TaxID=1387282 RepID=A0ABV9KF20_9RHOB
MFICRYVAILAGLLLAACGTVDFDEAPVGRFEGALLVMWVGEGDGKGAGKFVYVPSRTRPLTFIRNRPGAAVTRIVPEMMYTDGGSIPRAGQLFNGFSPWGYAPAYMVHDWIFVARHCLTDNMAEGEETKIEGMTFKESAEIIAEAIKTLIASGKVQRNDVAPRVISGVVAGPFSYERWVVKGACKGDRLTVEHRREVDEALARRSGLRSLKSAGPAARIVAEIAF